MLIASPENNWLNEIASVLDYGYDIVFGVAPIIKGKNLVEKLSAFENLRNTFLTIAAVGIKCTLFCRCKKFCI